ncbi:DDE-1 domain containing protein [Pyrenophora tritici-repentis]|nr:DDE-1 domain containing protein [Pyrenophora tritici-repentis]
MTDKLLDECASNPVGKNWVDNFVKRTPELRTCWSRPYNHRRAACEDLAAIQRWFDLVKSIKERWGIVDDDIYNFGETGFMMGKILSQIVIISSEGYGKKKRIQPGNREWVTVIQGVGASGRRLPPFVVFAGKVLIDVWFQNLPTDWVLEVSPNGRTNNQLALAWLEHFDTHTKSCTVVNVSRATITNLINQAYDPSSIAANNLSEILLRLQAAKEIAEYEKDALRAALHVHQKPRNRHEPPLDLQQRKAFHSGAVWWSPCKLREARFRQLVKEKEKEKELLDKIELKEAKENNRIYQLKIKEAARAAREEAKKVRDEAKAVKAAELDAKRRDRDAAKAIQQPQSGKRKASKPAAKQQPKKRRVGGAGGGTLAEVAAPAPPPTTTRRGRAVNTPAKYR